MIVNVHAAKTQLSKLIERALAGEEIVIARDSEPVVKLVALEKAEPRRQFGALKGELQVTDAFFAPLPADELAAWEQ